MEHFEGSGLAGADSISVYVGTCKAGVVNVWTGGKSGSCICKGCSVQVTDDGLSGVDSFLHSFAWSNEKGGFSAWQNI